MIISISGTPVTGKTKISKILSKKLNANLIDIKKLVNKGEIRFKHDKIRKTKIIDELDLKKVVKKYLHKKKINIIESHLSHLIKSDFVFVLRTNPKELKKRLEKRKWKKSKIRENLEAEIVDEITTESMEKNKKVFEIDTSNKKPHSVSLLIEKILKNNIKKYNAGYISWSIYFKELID